MKKKHVYVIAGPNGAGKTTFAREFLPRFAHCDEFVNADLIATGLSPFSPRQAAVQAGRLVLRRIRDLSEDGTSFGFETTLAGKTFLRLFKRLRRKGYEVHLFFLWLPKVELAIDRVRSRVQLGGHDVPETDIRRRYRRGLANFFRHYQRRVEDWALYDNSAREPRLIAFGRPGTQKIVDPAIFEGVKS